MLLDVASSFGQKNWKSPQQSELDFGQAVGFFCVITDK